MEGIYIWWMRVLATNRERRMAKAAGWAAYALAAPGHSSLSKTRQPICFVSPVSGQSMLANHMRHGSHMSQKSRGEDVHGGSDGCATSDTSDMEWQGQRISPYFAGSRFSYKPALNFFPRVCCILSAARSWVTSTESAELLVCCPFCCHIVDPPSWREVMGKTLASHLIAYYFCAFIIAHCCRCKGQRRSKPRASTCLRPAKPQFNR